MHGIRNGIAVSWMSLFIGNGCNSTCSNTITFCQQTQANDESHSLEREGLAQYWESLTPCRCHVSKNSGLSFLLPSNYTLHSSENLFKWIFGLVFLTSHQSPSSFDVRKAMKWQARHFAILMVWHLPIKERLHEIKQQVEINGKYNTNTTKYEICFRLIKALHLKNYLLLRTITL